MGALGRGGVFLFGGFQLDRHAGTLFRRRKDGTLVPMAVGSRALDVLDVLVERAGDLVSRDEFMAAVWPATAVEDANLNMQIAALRRVLDEGRAEGSCIQTIPGRGYRFAVPVARIECAALPANPSSSGNGSDGPIAESKRPEGPGAPERIGGAGPTATSRSRYRFWGGIMTTVIGALLVAAVTAGNWHSPWSGDTHPTPRLSIVVLPFANLGSDPEQQYLADGVTEDLTIDLSRIAHLFVISRNTAFSYRNKPVDTKQIGRELGVRYVLEGSVRRSGNQVRVTAQLIDAETDAQLWAERFDHDMGDLFALQNDITSRIAVALNLELDTAAATRPAVHPDALDYILRGRAALSKPPDRASHEETITLFERALALDPRSVEAQSYLAIVLVGRVLNEMSDSAAADIERAEGLAGQALAASPRSPLAHLAKGHVLRAQNRFEEAIPEYEAAIAFNHNWLLAITSLAWCKFLTGSLEEAIPLHEQAIRLSPRDHLIGIWYQRIGVAHLLQSRIDEAIAWLEKARNADPGHSQRHAWLASAYALKGDTERASDEIAEARRLNSDDRYSTIARLKAAQYWGVPKVRALFEATYFTGLRRAGVPEE
jgi:TolB-like protein/DNA-binding winged helix-turn-helix (wHTH) protein